MKNIRDYTPYKYNNEKEYTLIEPHIYKTMEPPSTNGIKLKQIEDKELENTLKGLNNWREGEGREKAFYVIDYNGKRYYKDPDDEKNSEEYHVFREVDLKPIYVTSIVFEPEPELGENEPTDILISQYPLEDILEKFNVSCYDDYKDENESDKENSYIEFQSYDVEDVINLRSIIGKHVYNVNEGNVVNLRIE